MKKQLSFIFPLTNFLKLANETKLPIRTAYKLSKLVFVVEAEERFLKQKMLEIFSECAEKNAEGNFIPTSNGKGIKLLPEKEKEYERLISELYSIEIELPDITFKMEEFEKMEITYSELEGILPFIEE